jgi:fucose permease
MMFLYEGLECTYGGWISSFAVLTGVTDNNGATVFPIIFWVLMTMFRIGLAFLPGKSSKKLQILIMSNILSGVITMLIIYSNHAKFACYLSGAMFGFSMSSLYPLTMTLPLEKGLNLEDNQTANILMSGVLAEGVLTMFVGWLMKWIHPNMLFYSLSAMGVMMWFIRLYCLHLMERQLEGLEKSELGEEL